nr:IS4 family transposase [Saprospira grandis]
MDSTNVSSFMLNKQSVRVCYRLVESLKNNPNPHLTNVAKTDADRKAFMRLLSNKNLTEEYIQFEFIGKSRESMKVVEEKLLAFHDTSEVVLNKQRNRLTDKEGLGPGGRETNLSVFLHMALLYGRESFHYHGLGGIQLYNRYKNRVTCKEAENRNTGHFRGEITRWKINVEETESALKIINDLIDILHVCDREGDVYPMMESFFRQHIKFLIRSRTDRRATIWEDGKKIPLCDVFEHYPADFETTETVKSSRKKLNGKKLVIRSKKVTFAVPKSCKYVLGEPRPKPMTINVIEVFEKGKGFSKSAARKRSRTKKDHDDETISWRLLTNEEINSEEELLELVLCYRKRWLIETYFKYLKSDGFDIENICLKTGKAIRKMILMAISASDKVLKLKEAGLNQDNETPATSIFTEDEVEVLDLIFKQYLKGESQSPSLRNPFTSKSIAWAYWIIARLGGFNGAVKKTRHAVSVKKIGLGLERFIFMYDGYRSLN